MLFLDRRLQLPSHSRRRLAGVIASAGAAFSTGLWPAGAPAGIGPLAPPKVLRGPRFELEIAPLAVSFLDHPRRAIAINGTIPGPQLRMREGETVTLRVTNRLSVPTSLHWHGLLVPADMDGVPGLSFDGIAPGATFVYRFTLQQSGTYWYHSHSRFQEQEGVYGSIVVEPRTFERHPASSEHVVVLSDWSRDDPEQVYATLKKMSDFFNRNQPTVPLFLRDVREEGWAAAVDKRRMWNRMRMNPTDLSDVSDATGRVFTYLMNGTPADGNWTALFAAGDRVKLRIVNAAATTIFDFRIPGLKLSVVAADGQDIHPVTVDELRISVAETYDVIVAPAADAAYTLYAQSIGRTGFVRGTLAPHPGMSASVPDMDPPRWLDMVDMMGAMSGPMSGIQPGETMAGMDHGANGKRSANSPPSVPHDANARTAGPPAVRHARTEYGPLVDNRVDTPRTNLDDPGVNLRGNGRRVLTYADVHSIDGPVEAREPQREIELHLTGHMQRFVWSFDGQKYSDSKPIALRFGERVRFVLVNDTMMNHPIHLHGMWSELEREGGGYQVRKHTINVQPAQRVTYQVSADALGTWAYHCHLLYHMEAGMFREVTVTR